ncbi:hypothetical protein [Gallaecimonas pentaromativorans]|uniref:hypothetical protein n=1 Tax=Gallaecimonas pentaromativorans TaxID=584787 RepID=UPI003A929B01
MPPGQHHHTLTANNGDWQMVNNDGTYTVTQLQAMSHPDNTDPNDPPGQRDHGGDRQRRRSGPR